MQQLGARLRLFLAALIVLLAAAASDRSHYFCKMMGRAVAECCCAPQHSPQRGRNTALRAADCCERLAASQQPVATLSHHAALPDFPVAALVATLPAFAPPEPSFRLVPAHPSPARAPPALGPPLFLSHCALLI
jgi:hypothetical protein